MLNVDPPGICASQIPDQLLVGWRILIGVFYQNIQKPLGFGLQMGRGQFFGILLGLLGITSVQIILPIQLLGTLPHRCLHSLQDRFFHPGHGTKVKGLL